MVSIGALANVCMCARTRTCDQRPVTGQFFSLSHFGAIECHSIVQFDGSGTSVCFGIELEKYNQQLDGLEAA